MYVMKVKEKKKEKEDREKDKENRVKGRKSDIGKKINRAIRMAYNLSRKKRCVSVAVPALERRVTRLLYSG